MEDELRALFAAVGVTGRLCVSAGDGSGEVVLDADAPVVAASVVKVLIALEAERQFCAGRLDPRSRVRLPTDGRTPGPVGFSLYRDDVEVSLGDLVVAALTISDNPAADALLDRVGLDTCAATAAELGLTRTVVVSDLATMIETIAADAGFADWAAFARWSAGSAAEAETVDRRLRGSAALDPTRATRTTARDLSRLLGAIWRDEAGPPAACARIRDLMGQQLTRARLASGFGPEVRVAAKSGGLLGLVRHEAGVVTGAGGRPPPRVTSAKRRVDRPAGPTGGGAPRRQRIEPAFCRVVSGWRYPAPRR